MQVEKGDSGSPVFMTSPLPNRNRLLGLACGRLGPDISYSSPISGISTDFERLYGAIQTHY